MNRRSLLSLMVAGSLLGLAAPALASYRDYRLPDDLVARRATILSEGTPMIAHVVQAKAQKGARLPTVILCQGTGGLQHYHLPQAIAFARAGFTAITFDYRGWGESRGRLIPAETNAAPRLDLNAYSARVVEVRDTVDPYEQSFDVMAVVAWAMAEPEVEPAKLGLWGTSMGASIALYVTIHEPRIRATVAQAGAYELRRGWADAEPSRQAATRRAHGELPYPPPQARVPGQLHGHLLREKYQFFSPMEDAARLAKRPSQPAILIIDAANEDLFDIRQQGQKLFEMLGSPKERVIIPGIKHYDIYRGEPLEQAKKLAVDWFERQLK
jgi:dienelactone hydrolase